jgi:hypothetical protein
VNDLTNSMQRASLEDTKGQSVGEKVERKGVTHLVHGWHPQGNPVRITFPFCLQLLIFLLEKVRRFN